MIRGARSKTRRTGILRRLEIIIAAYLICATSIAATAAHVLHAHVTPVTAVPRYLVLIVLDGARTDYFNLTSLPHVDALRNAGTQFTNGIAGVLEAETPSGHATIATGSRPDRNGILGFDWATDNDTYSLFSPDKMVSLEQVMQDAHVPTLASLYKQQHPGAKVVALSGHKYYAAAPLGGPNADAILYYQGDSRGHYVPVAVPGHVPPASVLNAPGLVYPTTHTPDGMEDHLATNLALAAFNTMRPRMLLINFPEFDWPLGHIYGGNLSQSRVITEMKAFDSDLGKLETAYQKAGILNQTVFVITADHGMMPISRFVPLSVINAAVSRAGTTAPNIATGSAAYVWLADHTRAQATAKNLIDTHDPGIQSVYYLTTVNGKPQYVAGEGSALSSSVEFANQYLLSALLNGHQPQVVAFGNEGVSFSDPKTGWKADHGGNSWQSQHIPLILSGPGIRSGLVSSAPVQLQDIAPTVLYDMGVTPTGMQGQPLTDALVQSSPALQQSRSAEFSWMTPVVRALQDGTHS